MKNISLFIVLVFVLSDINAQLTCNMPDEGLATPPIINTNDCSIESSYSLSLFPEHTPTKT